MKALVVILALLSVVGSKKPHVVQSQKHPHLSEDRTHNGSGGIDTTAEKEKFDLFIREQQRLRGIASKNGDVVDSNVKSYYF